jgi:hypothetical protein
MPNLARIPTANRFNFLELETDQGRERTAIYQPGTMNSKPRASDREWPLQWLAKEFVAVRWVI